MNNPGHLKIDLAEPASIAKGLAEAESKLERSEADFEQKEVARNEALQHVAYWRHMVATLGGLIHGQAGVQEHLSELQALVVEVVNREMRKIRAKDVTQILNKEGHDISGDSVSNALWYAAEKLDPKPIQRVGRGFYAPLAYQEDDLTPLLAAAGIGLGALLLSKGGTT